MIPPSQLDHPAVTAFRGMRAAVRGAKLRWALGTARQRVAELTPAAEAGNYEALYELAALEAAETCQCPPPGALLPRQLPLDEALGRAAEWLRLQERGPTARGGCWPCLLAL